MIGNISMKNKIDDFIRDIIQESIRIKQAILDEKLEDIIRATEIIIGAFKNKRKVLFFGNGGSASDAQHLAAEFINRFLFDRPALPAIALTTDTSVLTSIANDSDYRFIFSRQIEALGDKGDVAIGITTSGTSSNVVEGLEKARIMGMKTVAFIGGKAGDLGEKVDIIISVPSTSTPRIQEAHIMLGHIICQLVEEGMFSDPFLDKE
jgi:D-sedoheptulose 7-phosphate isomerase